MNDSEVTWAQCVILAIAALLCGISLGFFVGNSFTKTIFVKRPLTRMLPNTKWIESEMFLSSGKQIILRNKYDF